MSAQKLDKFRISIKDVNLRKIPKSKYEHNDLNEKYCWRQIIEEIENVARQNSRKIRNRSWDLSTTLPRNLYKRVAKIIPMVPIEEDRFDDEFKPIEEDEEFNKRKQSGFNESKLSEILDQEQHFQSIQLRLEPKLEQRKKKGKKVNWFSEYIGKKSQKDRVKWKSKLYKLEKNILEKPLFEQAEQLMDMAAEHFTDYVNNLGTDENSNITKDLIKQLFSLGIEESAASALNIDPKQISAVPNEIAERLNLPKISLELQVQKHLREREKKRLQKPHNIAFGRTLPVDLRKWIPTDIDETLEPVFPKDLLTAKTLFHGIGHLRSTKALVEYYQQNEHLPKPKYLIDIGCFKPSVKRLSRDHIPLYELLKK